MCMDSVSEDCMLRLLKHVEGTGIVIGLENFAKAGMGAVDRMDF